MAAEWYNPGCCPVEPVRPSLRAVTLAAALCGLAPGPVGWCQFSSGATGIEADLPELGPPAPPRLPSLVLRADTTISVPGPLAGEGPRVQDQRLALRVAGGLALATATPGAAVDLVPDPGPAPSGAWVERPDGRMRFRCEAAGRVVAEKRPRRPGAGWKRHWRLRVGGETVAAPVVLGSRVCFGTLENRVYCVRDRNGHRLWAVDVGGRVSSGLVPWSGRVAPESPADPAQPPVELEAILVVPDGGSELLALAAVSGQKLAGLQVTAHGERLVGAPAVTPDGRVAVARQGYQPEQAALEVYRLFLAPPPPPAPAAIDAVSPSARRSASDPS